MFVPYPELKNNIGWSLIFFTSINIIVNMGIILVNGFKYIRMIFKRIVKKIKNKRSKKFYIDQDITFENYHLENNRDHSQKATNDSNFTNMSLVHSNLDLDYETKFES
jgi:hypothetical protein